MYYIVGGKKHTRQAYEVLRRDRVSEDWNFRNSTDMQSFAEKRIETGRAEKFIESSTKDV